MDIMIKGQHKHMATTTTNLMNEISKEKNLDKFKKRMQAEYVDENISSMLIKLINIKGVTIPEIIRDSNLAKGYVYEIINGTKKNPARDKVLAILIAIGCDINEVNNFLKRAGIAAIDERNVRDSLIYFCINSGFDVLKTNDLLINENCNPLE